MSTKKGRVSVFRQLLKSKSAIAGITIIIILAILTAYSVYALPSSLNVKWENGDNWVLNPLDAPPTWVSFLGVKTAPSLTLDLSHWRNQSFASGVLTVYIYTSNVSFSYTNSVFPQNLAFVSEFSGQATQESVTFQKPSGGGSLVVTIPTPDSGQAYEATNVNLIQSASQYILHETGSFSPTLVKAAVVNAFFGLPKNSLSNASVLEGTYSVVVTITTDSPISITSSSLVIIGTSYGSMGTDNLGRPVDLGILAGLPNALEIGFLVAIISVFVGIFFGGISGYLGGRKDNSLQWVTLVILAMPVLPFLVLMSYTTKLNVWVEVLLIAALSWPFYAIIARTVALSVRSQTFVEADKAMGIPSHRVFLSHFMPRLVPVTVAYTVLGIPGGILLAETLSFIGVVPPNLITWGGILDAAFTGDAAVYGFWWWVVFPGIMIIIAATPFVLLGFALERIIAPRVAAK